MNFAKWLVQEKNECVEVDSLHNVSLHAQESAQIFMHFEVYSFSGWKILGHKICLLLIFILWRKLDKLLQFMNDVVWLFPLAL